jgi:hypothetical protein
MRRWVAVVATASALGLSGCTADWATQNDSAILFEIAQISAASASVTGSGASSNILYSDVSQVVNDDVVVEVNIFQKNPLISASSPNNHVYLDSYRVRFFRTDGRNVEGVDVPYSISGPMSLRLHTPSAGQEVAGAANITLVRHQAKIEPPLSNMRAAAGAPVTLPLPSSGGLTVLTVIAEVTVFGKTLTGSNVTATGRIQVTFADFVDS